MTDISTIQPQVKQLVDALGVAEASRKLGLTRESTLMLAAGLRVRTGTAAHAAAQLPLALATLPSIST